MSGTVIIDTNAYSAFLKADQAIVDILSSANRIYVPWVVTGELYAGFFNGSKSQKNISDLAEFLRSPRVEILYPTEKTSVIFGEIMVELKKAGKPIQTNDVWIAAISKEHNSPLLTYDLGFRHIVGLQLLV